MLVEAADQPDEKAIHRLARNAAGPPLWREPLLVTAAGIQPFAIG